MSTQHQALTSKVFDLFQYEKILQNSTIGFLLLLQLANKRKKLFIYRKEGAWPPQGGRTKCRGKGCQVWRVRAPLLQVQPPSVNQTQTKGEGATSMDEGLPPQEGATSPRGAHLPRPTSSNLIRFTINQIPITWIVFPLTFGLTLPLILLQICPPLFFFYFHLADFIELKCTFLGFEGKIKIK
jgi:hypothetical protein